MFESLLAVSDHEILATADDIIVQDRKLTLRLLVHLHEIERRKLYLKRGYSSMFVYCTSHLRLSEPAAVRRIRTARCLARVPKLYAMLGTGEVNLTTVSMVAKFLRPENADTILARIRGKSRREVEAVVAEFEPRAAIPADRVRMLMVPVAVPGPLIPMPTVTVAGDGKKLSIAEAANGEDRRAGDDDQSPAAAVTSCSPRAIPALERRALIQFAAGEDFMTLLARVRSIASHRLPPNATLEQVFALVMDHYVEHEDPRARHDRRERKRGVMQARAVKRPEGTKAPRQIRARVRDHVFVRDEGRCTYVSSGGRRCDSRHLIQIDHITPVAHGGGNALKNLRLLCAEHNRLEVERLMGLAGRPRLPVPSAMERATQPCIE